MNAVTARRDRPSCTRNEFDWSTPPWAFAEYVAVPEKNVYLLEDYVTFDEGAFAEPFAVAVHLCRLLQLDPTNRLLIMGAGPIGLFTLQVAQVYGLKNIVVVDLNEERLEIVKELGGISATSLGGCTRQDHLMRLSMRWALKSHVYSAWSM